MISGLHDVCVAIPWWSVSFVNENGKELVMLSTIHVCEIHIPQEDGHDASLKGAKIHCRRAESGFEVLDIRFETLLVRVI